MSSLSTNNMSKRTNKAKRYNHTKMCVWSSHIIILYYIKVEYSMDQPRKVAHPAMIVVSLSRKIKISLSPFAPKSLVSRDRLGHPNSRPSARCPNSG